MFDYMLISVICMAVFFIFTPRLKPLLMLCSFVVSILYITWRFYSIPSTGIPLVGGILLYAAEIIGFIQFIVFCYISSQDKPYELKLSKNDPLPTVDIIIPTYGEPIYILKRTIIAAIALTYDAHKKTIYVCDDGKRLEVKQLCESLGVHYIVRKDNKHAKSGNINHALAQSTGELIAVFDADMIPKNNFLLKLVPYFSDSTVGFVQAPQSFYNPDIFQRTFKHLIPSEQDFFMHDVQERRSYINAAIHVGTNALFRRRCIEEIGGYPTFSITEDIAVGLMIQAKGYLGIYVNEPLVLGLNPTNIKDLLLQRDRWCRGNLQLLKHKNPLFIKGLTIGQKIAYLDGIMYWYTGLLKMIFILAPMIFLLTGTFFINASVDKLLMMFIPYFISQYLVFNCSYSRTRSMFWAHIYETILAPYIAKSCLVHLFGSFDLDFKVTNKDVKIADKQTYIKEALPHMTLLLFAVTSIAIGFYNYFAGQLSLIILAINIIWIIYNTIPSLLFQFIIKQNTHDPESKFLIKNQKLSIQVPHDRMLLNYPIISISDSILEIEQLNQRTLLNGEEITFYINQNKQSGLITSSTKGKASILIDDSLNEGYLNFLSIYANNIEPFYDLHLEQQAITMLEEIMNVEIDPTTSYDLSPRAIIPNTYQTNRQN